MTNDGLQVNGWLVSNQLLSHPYLLVMNDDKEVSRTTFQLTSYPDITKAYRKFNNSANIFSHWLNLPQRKLREICS